jgi:hypothetical protein
MSNGSSSNYPLYYNQTGWTEVRINPPGEKVRKVIIFGRPSSEIGGIQFFDRNNNLIL